MRDSFVFQAQWQEGIKTLPPIEQAEAFNAIVDYASKGLRYEGSNAAIKMLLAIIEKQIDEQNAKYQEVCDKRKNAAMERWKNKNNANASKSKQKHANASNCTICNDLHYDNHNNISSSTNVESDIDKEKKELKEKEETEFVERMYKLYPSKCPMRNASLGKCSKDKDRIRKLLRTYTKEEIESTIRREIEEKYGKHYMQNFSTFLNNFPDPQQYHPQDLFSQDSEMSKSEDMVIDGQVYR